MKTRCFQNYLRGRVCGLGVVKFVRLQDGDILVVG